METPEEMRQKMKVYSDFIEETLKPALKKAETTRNSVKDEIQDYQELRQRLKEHYGQGKIDQYETKVDLGHKTLYSRAVAKDVSQILVNVGMGFHVEFSISEAVKVVEDRINFLEKKLSVKNEKVQEVSNHLQSAILVFQQLEIERQRL